jgi:predicted alpha/beta superfamily hydrolase
MKEIKRFQVRGIPGAVTRADFSGRIVDFWAPDGGSDHLLIAHDGQNIFDPRSATFLRQTWKMAQTAIRVFSDSKLRPPIIVGIFHSSNKSDPWGRLKDLSPESAFRSGIQPLKTHDSETLFDIAQLRGNQYLDQIFNEITPAISSLFTHKATPDTTAMIGSSMGGLATLNAFSRHSDFFNTCLAFSPHWVLAGNPLVDYLISNLPHPANRKFWMSRGTKGLDASYEQFQNRADEMTRKAEWGKRFKTKVYHRTGHNERSWASYLDEALKFWID